MLRTKPDDGTEHTLSKLTDGRRRGAVLDAADISAAVQRDFNMPEKWAHRNIATYSKGKCKVL